jgi:hypothetical protein
MHNHYHRICQAPKDSKVVVNIFCVNFGKVIVTNDSKSCAPRLDIAPPSP